MALRSMKHQVAKPERCRQGPGSRLGLHLYIIGPARLLPEPAVSHMKAALFTLLIAANATALLCATEDGSYSNQFQRAYGDRPVPFQVASGSLVDTNNSSPTVRGNSLSLSVGAVGGVRPGMSMNEVI